jgi:sugar lactone lactonase YvrE
VLKLDANGKESVIYRDTNTGGSLSRNSKGALFVVSRALNPSIVQLAPQRKVLANSFQGEPLDCVGGILNDLSADSKGGVYFTLGGLYYANSQGVITQYGQGLQTNGIILSPDEKTLYVTNGPAVAAFDVQADGSLRNQREFAKLAGGSGDGSTVDGAGRLYVSTGSSVDVFAPDGKYLGTIPGLEGLHGVAFSGPEKKTLYAMVLTGFMTPNRQSTVISIPTIAQGFAGRAK